MNRTTFFAGVLMMTAAIGGQAVPAAPAPPAWRVTPEGRTGLRVWRGDDQVLSLELDVRPGGGLRTLPKAMPTATGQERIYEEKLFFYRGQTQEAGPLDLRYEARQSDPHTLRLRLLCQSKEDLTLEGVAVSVPALDQSCLLQGGRMTVALSDGKSVGLSITQPGGAANLSGKAKSVWLESPRGDRIDLELGEAAPVTYQGHALNVWLAQKSLAGGKPRAFDLTVRFSQPVAFEARNPIVDTADWFLYAGKQDFEPGSAIGMDGWLERPAGKRGYAKIDGNRFVFEDGTPVKFWGTNISWADMARPADEVKRYAQKFAKHGVNIVRMHKFVHKHTGLDGWPFDASPIWDGIMDPNNPMEFHKEAMERFDNMHAELKERGIYSGWSPIAFFAFHEKYRDRLIAYDELRAIRDANPFWVHSNNILYPFSSFAPDVRDLQTELIVRLLNRVNARTGLRYADDPALAFVEYRNEESIFFWGIEKAAAHSPVYKGIISKKFCEWLKARYPSEEALRAAWQGEGLKEGESLKEGTIFPFPGWGKANSSPVARRLLDSYRFLFEYQDDDYQRFVQAVRKTGYRGPLVGSGWAAADWLGHLYNLENDRRVGVIDRHPYHRGMMIRRPGFGVLGGGRMVVSDRPFAATEWAGSHVYAAEVSPLVGFIGLGLQGWDTSTQYGSNWWGIATHARTGIHDTSEAFHHIGQWPFISRILQSGALREGEVIARRRVSLAELNPPAGQPAADVEMLSGAKWEEMQRAIPDEALGIGRVEIEFVDQPVKEKLWMADLDKYWDRDKRVIRASNGQIVWDYSGRGFVTANTPAGVAVIGFGGKREHTLGPVTLSYDVPFANVYVVPRHPGETLDTARSLVILALARTADQGDVIEEDSMTPLSSPERPHPGGGRAGAIRHWIENPALIFEPVQLNLALRRDVPCRVYALDHDGRLPAGAAAIPVERAADSQRFVLDGKRLRTMYYLVEFENR